MRRLVAFALVVTGTTLARAEVLVLPAAASGIVSRIAEACPACVAPGFLPCGGPDVQYGRAFAQHALQGEPARGYLLGRAPVSAELAPLVREPDLERAMQALADAFAPTRLVVIEDAWQEVRVLAPHGAPSVKFDAAQHACFRDPARSMSCCLGDGPADRGCLPKADPPTVQLHFDDAVAGEAVAMRWPVGAGELKLRRSETSGGRETLYWCHKSARAPLR
jgi:hypothetical protein